MDADTAPGEVSEVAKTRSQRNKGKLYPSMATKDKDEQENKGHHLYRVMALYRMKKTTSTAGGTKKL